ncbi:pyridoxamine 5'-phosphate oxidase family protein [Marinilongibacter aquaticus]|uniref:pyridoxamine 5'-phosphate oxidase family protein n=1 Tax=Marinilongibacter aquaticus TaxID=2975157 RepID=UPI0021BD727F|nr:pyridoxamine 5'-phosphate oxidase family protein [Marinilongibacter aquaticus]UBM59270.1 pyridoxamine 5'-phosphate oxidase family protein [Marinilongibacter aquaticus]
MAKKFDQISDDLQNFIAKQKIFFVGTAMADGHVNVSPKGTDSLRVLDSNRIVWRNLTGSGNETAVHLEHINRITLMWCAFEGKPLILRCYGTAKVYHENDAAFDELNALFSAHTGARQIFDVQVDLVQTSCGYAVPFMDYKEDRDVLDKWAAHKGREGIREYWEEKNSYSLDGKASGITTK